VRDIEKARKVLAGIKPGRETEKVRKRDASEAPTAPLTTSTCLKERLIKRLLAAYSFIRQSKSASPCRILQDVREAEPRA
jgi:hypothetical protein